MLRSAARNYPTASTEIFSHDNKTEL